MGPKPGIELKMLSDGEDDHIVKVVNVHVNLVSPAPKLALLSVAYAAASSRIVLSDDIFFQGTGCVF